MTLLFNRNYCNYLGVFFLILCIYTFNLFAISNIQPDINFQATSLFIYFGFFQSNPLFIKYLLPTLLCLVVGFTRLPWLYLFLILPLLSEDLIQLNSYISSNQLLSNAVNNIHPPLLNMVIIFALAAPLVRVILSLPCKYIFLPLVWDAGFKFSLIWYPLFKLLFFTLFLGMFWSFQMGTWDGWWAWDSSEVLIFFIFIVLLLLVHLVVARDSVLAASYFTYVAACFFYSFYFYSQIFVLSNLHSFFSIISDPLPIQYSFVFVFFLSALSFFSEFHRASGRVLGPTLAVCIIMFFVFTIAYFAYALLVADIYLFYRFVCFLWTVFFLSQAIRAVVSNSWYTLIHLYWSFIFVLILFTSHKCSSELFVSNFVEDFFNMLQVNFTVDSLEIQFGFSKSQLRFNNSVYLYLSDRFLPLTVSPITSWSLANMLEFLYFTEDFFTLFFL